jgi:hypothetical protein
MLGRDGWITLAAEPNRWVSSVPTLAFNEMSLLAEEVVEEWLNRKGYFTIRGIRLGVDEIDLLAIKLAEDGTVERRHLEVQASVRPVSYICRVPKEIQRATGRAANSAKRSDQELVEGVAEWIDKKFRKANKVALLRKLSPGVWSKELVLHNVKSDAEVELIRNHGIVIHRLATIVAELRSASAIVPSASGGSLLELIHISASGLGSSSPSEEAEFIAE